jgi:predicted protein tyrosine phosphatase
MRFLYVCSANLNRSPTFARVFKERFPEVEVKSTGVWHGFPDRLNQELMQWADWIFVMDLAHEAAIRKNFPDDAWKVSVIGISDEYDVDSPQLVELVNYWIDKHFMHEIGFDHFADCSGSMCWCAERLKND